MRDTLDCRSPSRCSACEHFDKGVCQLEQALDALLAPPRIIVPVLAVRDARAAA